MLSLLQFFSILFLISFCLPLGNGTTVSYVSPIEDKTFCMSPEMHEQCGAYCYQTFKPVLEHVVQLTEEIARKDEEIKKMEKFVELANNNVLAMNSRFLEAFGKEFQWIHNQLSTPGNPSQNSKP